MARKPKGFTVRKRGVVHYVRFSGPHGRVEVSTGERDPVAAQRVAAELYAAHLAGRIGRVAAPARVSSREPLDALVADWLASASATHDVESIKTWVIYARKHWLPFFGSLAGVLAPGRLQEYARSRLGRVLRKTVLKELSGIRTFLLWLQEQQAIVDVPAMPELPRRAVGVRAGTQREHAVQLSPDQVAAFLAALPERSAKGYPVRARFMFAYETGLRPATIDAIEVGRHWTPGAAELRITRDIDKIRNERTVPLSPLALEILVANAPKTGRVFPPFVARKVILATCRRAGLPKIAPYDLRHARATHLVEGGASLPGVSYLLGHLKTTTTDGYVHASARAAAEILGQNSGASGGGGAFSSGDRRVSNPRQLKPQSSGAGPAANDFGELEDRWAARNRRLRGVLGHAPEPPEAGDLVSWAREYAAGLAPFDLADEYALRLDRDGEP